MIASPVIDLSTIPAAQRAAVQALLEEVAALKDITKRQEHLIAELNHALHGERSEKLSEDERQLAFEDLSIALAEVEAEKEARAAKADTGKTKPAPKRTIGNLPAALPRIEEVIEPASLICPCGCGVMHRIGEDRSERLDIVPAQLRIVVTVRPKYACRTCTDGVTQAPAPSHLIMGGLPTEASIAHVLVSKYADHLPLYRQSQILARAGLDLHRAVLADWVGKAAFHLKPVVDRLADHLKRSGKLFMDETTAPVLDPGRGTTKTGYLWALARDDRPWAGEDPPGVVYFYAPGRAGENAETFLAGFDGILQIDGYTGYNRLTKPSRKGGAPVRVAHCWAHARRKLKEVFDRDGSEIAAEGLRRIAEIYAVEADIRGNLPSHLEDPMPILTWSHWRKVPNGLWRWKNFSPAEIACRGTGTLKIDTEALDKLQELRDRLRKPLIIRSAYRSPAHNRAVGGAQRSKHMDGTAFDIAMANHDPVVFEAAAREVGFLGFGYYPRSGFMHIDLGPARSWGEKFPVRAVPFAPETPPAREVLAESRTLRGAGAAGVGAVGAVGVEVAQQVLTEAQGAVLPLIPHLDTLRWLFLALALAGIVVTIWARVDDWRRGLR